MKVCMAQKQRKPAWRKSRGSLHDAKAEEACMQYKRGNQHAAKALKPALCKKSVKTCVLLSLYNSFSYFCNINLQAIALRRNYSTNKVIA